MAKVRTISCKQAKKNPTKRTANPTRKATKKKVAKKAPAKKRTVAKKAPAKKRTVAKKAPAKKRTVAKNPYGGWAKAMASPSPKNVPPKPKAKAPIGVLAPNTKPYKTPRLVGDVVLYKAHGKTLVVKKTVGKSTTLNIHGSPYLVWTSNRPTARELIEKFVNEGSLPKKGAFGYEVTKSNPSNLPPVSRKYRAKKAVRKAAESAKEATKRAGRRAATATKEAAKRGGRKAAEMSKDAAVWTGKKVAKGGKRAGRKLWGTTKEAAKGTWAGIKKGWKENPTAAPKSVISRIRRLEHKALELYTMSDKETRDSEHYYKEAEKLMHEAQNLAYEHGVDLSSTKGLPSAWEVANNPITAAQRKRMSLSLFALPKLRKYRLDSPARNKYSLTLLNKHYQDGVRSKQEYATAYINIMVAFIKNGQIAKRAPLVKTPATTAAFKAASPLKNPAHPVSVAAKKKAMQ